MGEREETMSPNIVSQVRKRKMEEATSSKGLKKRPDYELDFGLAQRITLEEGFEEPLPPTIEESANEVELSKKKSKDYPRADRRTDKAGVLGHIVKVHLKDFMVHRDFEWKPGHCINFITGKNGSGKSSLLQAIVIGLMSGAKHVGRYSSLGEFVRKGAHKFVISVTLNNSGEEGYRQHRYGLTLTFRRTVDIRGLSSLDILDSNGTLIVSGKAGLQEACNILRALNIQLANPLTILQQDHAKEMLQVEKPEKLYSFFESATMISQCRDEYKRSATELAVVARNLEGQKREMVELKTEANAKLEIVKEGIRMRKKDEHYVELEKQSSWAKVILRRQEVITKEADLGKMETKKQKLLQLKLEIEEKLKDAEGTKAALAKESEEEMAGEERLNNEAEIFVQKEKDLKIKRKNLVAQSKKLITKQKSLEEELKVLEEMKVKVSRKSSKVLLDDIATLEAEVNKFEKERGIGEQKHEQLSGEHATFKQDLMVRQEELSKQETVLANLRKELNTAKKDNQGQEDSLTCYHGARQVEVDINRQSSQFEKLPIGPVGRFIRVNGDKNLLDLVEAELGSRLVRSYLVDNSRDARLLSRILDKQYGATASKPMIVTSRFLAARHKVVKPLLPAGSRCLLDLLQLQGSSEEQVVVFNCIVDQRGVEGVAVCEDQQIAGNLCSGLPIAGLSSAVTLDWYRFLPPSHHTAFRSYYINRWRSLHLTTVHETDMLKRKEEEVAEAEVLRDSMSREVNEVKRESARLGKCISDVERNLSTAKSNILKSKAQLKKKEQERDVAGDQNESERLELKMEDTRKTLESLMEDQRNIDTESEQVDESFKELAAKKASSHAKTAEITEKALLLRQKKDKLDAKCRTFASKLLSNNDDLKTLDEDLASQLDLLNSCKADLQTLELKARELSEGTELVPEDSLAKLEAKMEALVKEKLERGETDYGAAARARYIELSSQVSLKVQKIDNLKQFSRSLENQMGSRRVLFQTLRDKVVDMVERRFSILAGQTMATMQLRLNIDPSKKQLSFRFGPEQRSSKVGSLSGGEKSYSQLCLILSLWHFMTTPFRCLDEWDVFMDSVNRAMIGAELVRFAKSKEGTHQFIFLSPQGAVEVPPDAGDEFKVFTLGEAVK